MKPFNKQYIANCIRKVYPELEQRKLKFTDNDIILGGNSIVLVKAKVRGVKRIRNFLLSTVTDDFDPTRLRSTVKVTLYKKVSL